MIVPWQQLSTEALNGIIEEFIMREGTDYGELEVSLQTKKNQLIQQLQQNKIVLVYSELHETVNLMPADKFKESVEQ
jgi:hypothetical protein